MQCARGSIPHITDWHTSKLYHSSIQSTTSAEGSQNTNPPPKPNAPSRGVLSTARSPTSWRKHAARNPSDDATSMRGSGRSGGKRCTGAAPSRGYAADASWVTWSRRIGPSRECRRTVAPWCVHVSDACSCWAGWTPSHTSGIWREREAGGGVN